MRASVLSEARTFSVTDLPEPSVDSDGVTVRVEAVAICGSDLTGYLGSHPRIKPPTVLGHEFAGVVEAVGAEVDGVRAGDRVAVDPTSGCGACRLCRRGLSNICPGYRVMGESVDLPGAMAGLVAVPAASVHRLPNSVPFDEGAIVQPLGVAYHATAHRGEVSAGDVVVVLGAGAIGLGALMVAKAAGATVVVVDLLRYRLKTAAALGADHVATPDELTTLVAGLSEGLGADVVIEAVGGSRQELLHDAVRLTRPGGRVVVVGLKLDAAAVPIRELKYQEKVVLGSQAHPGSFPAVIRMIEDGTLDAGALITHRMSLHDPAAALRLLEERADGVIKVVLLPSPGEQS